MHVSCSSHTWFIYDLNTSFYQLHSHSIMIHIHRLTILCYGAISHYSPCWFPLANSPCQFPFTYQETLLFVQCDPRPPWSQVAHKLTSPSPSQIPIAPGFPRSIAPYQDDIAIPTLHSSEQSKYELISQFFLRNSNKIKRTTMFCRKKHEN